MTKNLYDPSFEHDACGVGMVADLTGVATHATVRDALTILENLEHRGATGSDIESGDGAGILLQMPDAFIRAVFGDVVPAAGRLRRRPLDDSARIDLVTRSRRHRPGPRARRPRSLGLARRARSTRSILGPDVAGQRAAHSSNSSSLARHGAGRATSSERSTARARSSSTRHDVYASSCSSPGAHLQGHADGRPSCASTSRDLARRAARLGDRRRAQPLLDQRPASMGPRPALSATSPTTARSTRCGAIATG